MKTTKPTIASLKRAIKQGQEQQKVDEQNAARAEREQKAKDVKAAKEHTAAQQKIADVVWSRFDEYVASAVRYKKKTVQLVWVPQHLYDIPEYWHMLENKCKKLGLKTEISRRSEDSHYCDYRSTDYSTELLVDITPLLSTK